MAFAQYDITSSKTLSSRPSVVPGLRRTRRPPGRVRPRAARTGRRRAGCSRTCARRDTCPRPRAPAAYAPPPCPGIEYMPQWMNIPNRASLNHAPRFPAFADGHSTAARIVPRSILMLYILLNPLKCSLYKGVSPHNLQPTKQNCDSSCGSLARHYSVRASLVPKKRSSAKATAPSPVTFAAGP